MNQVEIAGDLLAKTRSAFLWTRLLNIPFWAIFNMLAIFLYKDLNATPLQITAIIALKPISALFCPYWSSSIYQRQDRLLSNLVWGNILKFLPFLLFPWLESPWLFVLAFGLYMAFSRGVIPAWMEVIKLNIKGTDREKVFAIGSTIEYLGSAIIPLSFGWILDDYHDAWRWIFFGSALIGVASTIFLFRIPKTFLQIPKEKLPATPLFQKFAEPWKQSWNLLKMRPDFANYQIGFMLAGGGLMLMQTCLPMFYVDVLHLSYKEILFAITVCKGFGFAFSSSLWVKWFNRVNIFRLSCWVDITIALFPILLVASTFHIFWLYLAFVIYGVMQGGSELSWHLSGPYFAKETDSSLFSATNVLTVGVRGCVAPLMGSAIYSLTNSIVVMSISLILIVIAAEWMRYSSLRFADGLTASQEL